MRGLTVLVALVAICGCGSTNEERVATTEGAATSKTQLVWLRQFGTTEHDLVQAVARCEGAVYVAGRTLGALALPSSIGGFDSYLRKYDPNGTLVWTRQFGNDEDDGVNGVVCDASGVYVAGYKVDLLQEEGVVRKFAHDTGEELWSSSFSPGGANAAAIAIDATGVYVVGRVDGTFSGEVSAGESDAYVMKIELGTAQTIWTRQFGTSAVDRAASVFVDPTGVYVAGETGGAFDGAQSQGGADTFVRKYDLNGTAAAWTRQIGTAINDAPRGIAGDATGLYLGIDSSPTASVRRFNRSGDPVWTVSFTGSVFGVAADDTGAYISGALLGGLLARKYDPRGRTVWSHLIEANPSSTAFGLAADPTGVYLGGWTTDALAGQTNEGGVDGFLLKLALTTGATARPKPR